MLRLEQLFDRLGALMARDSALDHHFALFTLFEIMDVASRADLKSDMLKELERQRSRLQSFRGNPQISAATLDAVLERVDSAFEQLNTMAGKAGQALTQNDWLMGVRSRISIPGGTCSFDLPGYHAWQQLPAAARRADIERWSSTLAPLVRALRLLLGLIREGSAAQRVHAPDGVFQQRLPEGKTYHLLRVDVDTADGRIPEISGHRLMISVRMMRPDAEGRLRPDTQDISFDMALCA